LPALLELQRAFGASLLDSAELPVLLPLLENERPAQRLAVYRGNLYGNCLGALAGAYPVVRAILGEGFFDAMGKEFLRAHPPGSGDLNALGRDLPQFVAAFAHTRDLPYLADVARLEWLAHRAYFAADAQDFPLSRLAGADDPGALRPVLAPACALLESAWPVADIWNAHKHADADPCAVDLNARPQRVLVHRPLWRVEVTRLPRGDYRFLSAAASGVALGDALEAALAEDAGFDPGSALARWVSAGAIVELA